MFHRLLPSFSFFSFSFLSLIPVSFLVETKLIHFSQSFLSCSFIIFFPVFRSGHCIMRIRAMHRAVAYVHGWMCRIRHFCSLFSARGETSREDVALVWAFISFNWACIVCGMCVPTYILYISLRHCDATRVSWCFIYSIHSFLFNPSCMNDCMLHEMVVLSLANWWYRMRKILEKGIMYAMRERRVVPVKRTISTIDIIRRQIFKTILLSLLIRIK